MKTCIKKLLVIDLDGIAYMKRYQKKHRTSQSFRPYVGHKQMPNCKK